MNVQVIDPATGSIEHDLPIEDLRSANADSDEVIEALDRIAAGSTDEIRVGGGAAALYVLRRAR